ncbi:hypothetical protein G6F37_009439 [Rhizopus arrhizus]|nr:hypothetical protein G6F38_009513 [Rhizopus arrhizus]KAG1154452.1 hypothetical protein G6F37_009439 [Rhizopus arrhizus]
MSFDQNNTKIANKQETSKNEKDLNYSPNNSKQQYGLSENKSKKKKQQQQDPNAPCYIHQLSVEVIAHVFSRLDPLSLATVAKVCHYWRHVVNDDRCWKDAFVSYFGKLPYRRLSLESWKTEYILRTHLIRKWTKSRGSVISFIPKIGSLESMYVDFDDSSMVVASIQQGTAAKCNPMTGKVDRHLLYSTNESIPLHVTATHVDKDRIAWGFQPGYITLLVRTKTSANVASRLKVFSDFHQGPVRIFSLPSNIPDVILSGADDGQIKIWDISTTSCILTLPGPSTVAKPTCLEVTNNQKVIVGYSDGTVIIWNININQFIQLNRNRRQQNYQEQYRDLYNEINEKRYIIPCPAVINGSVAPVRFMLCDTETNMVIVAYKGQTEFRKYNLDTGSCTAVFGDGHITGTSITCMQWDVSYPKALSLEEALKPHPNNKKRSNIIHLSTPRSSGQTTPLSPVSTSARATRLLVTGDDLGVVCLWNGDEVSKEGIDKIKPIQTLNDGHLAGISSIYVDACKIVTGSDDGWIRIWDPLTGINIHTLGNKIPKNAPVDRSDMDVMRVKNISCSEYQGVATIGHQIKTWDFSPGKQLLNRRQLKPKGKSASGNLRDRHRYDIDQEVKESIQKLESEKKERHRHELKLSKLTLEGLSDEEMLHYALMLSQDPSSGSTPQPSDSRDNYVEDEDDLLKAVIASLSVTDSQETDVKESMIESNALDTSIISSNSNNNGSEQDERLANAKSVSNQHEEELDEELRYVLELSKTDK